MRANPIILMFQANAMNPQILLRTVHFKHTNEQCASHDVSYVLHGTTLSPLIISKG